ncbi:MAG: flagellar basal body protein FliL [Treponema sp.]|nr:flagellar basal body protein FliL [Treponema sp.]
MPDPEDIDIEEGDSPEVAPVKKKSALAKLLPTILKIAAIGIVAVIFIITVSVITVNVVKGDGRSQTTTDPADPYIGVQPVLQWFTDIGVISTNTRDSTPVSVTVVMNLGFDMGDQATASELFGRQHEIRDFTRRYFASRFAEELVPENEARLRREIMDTLNTRYFNNARIRHITFTRLDVVPVF